MRNKQLDLAGLIRVIEMDDSILDFLTIPTSQDTLKFSIDHLKWLVKIQRRRLAKKYHPDIGGDPERMKEINDACDLLMKIEVEMTPPMPSTSPLWDMYVRPQSRPMPRQDPREYTSPYFRSSLSFTFFKARPAWGRGFTSTGSTN